ncbi:MAG: LysM peptidoglycan-binding domain-containing protein [Bacteroidales bacterium]|nr:LysM peptidoglycan-binding domain-containing protein [Bacteroidales bacterium]
MKNRNIVLLFLMFCFTLPAFAQNCGKHIFTAQPGDFPETYFPYTKRAVFVNNNAKFIIAREGDTYLRIGNEVNISENDMRSYNDVVDWQYEPCPGEVVYLTPKKTKCGTQYHKIEAGESLRGIAQKYAIQMKTLYKKNFKLAVPLNDLHPGDRICISCK